MYPLHTCNAQSVLDRKNYGYHLENFQNIQKNARCRNIRCQTYWKG